MEVGRIIGGKYRLGHEIGEGAMGSVWTGVHELLGRKVAIKFMRPALEDAETAAARFVAEAKAAAQLKHRFIVDVFDFGITEDGHYYMVQELLDGESLALVLEKGPAWPVQDVLRFAAQCLNGLSAVHASGIVHRDLKPENIFVMRDGEDRFPKLLDFGISKAASGVEQVSARGPKRPSLRAGSNTRAPQLTAVGAAPGTPAYMSPEQLRNQSDLDARADLYSMGVLLYEWLSGRCPYAGTSDFGALYRQIRERSMTPLARLRPELDAQLCQLVTRALAFEAKDRFASAAEMREALLQCASLSSTALAVVQAPGVAAVGTSRESKPRRRMGEKTQVLLASASDPFADPDDVPVLPTYPIGRVLAAGALGLVLALGLWFTTRSESSQDENKPALRAAPAASAATVDVPPLTPASSPPPAENSNAEELPVAADVQAEDLPLGADMPDEDLPVSLPVGLSAQRSEGARDKTRSSSHERRRERVAMQPTNAPAQKAAATSSPSADRPIKQKVVRQLDF